MIVGGWVAYNAEGLIGESIRSARAYLDRVVVLDVAFTSNPGDGPCYSTDRTKSEAVLACGTLPHLYVRAHERLSEVEARNAVIGFCTSRDWLLVLDADERLIGDHESLTELRHWLLSGKIPDPIAPMGLAVFTTAVQFEGMAPAMTPEEYAANPVICSVGIQPRLVPVRDSQYRLISPDKTPALHHRGNFVGTGTLASEAIVLNDRTRQSFESYQSAYRWESNR